MSFFPVTLVFQVLAGEISPFMCSGSHQAQVDTFPSSVHTILEGVSKCNPAVPIRPCILKVELRLHIHVTNVERLRCTPLFSNLP